MGQRLFSREDKIRDGVSSLKFRKKRDLPERLDAVLEAITLPSESAGTTCLA